MGRRCQRQGNNELVGIRSAANLEGKSIPWNRGRTPEDDLTLENTHSLLGMAGAMISCQALSHSPLPLPGTMCSRDTREGAFRSYRPSGPWIRRPGGRSALQGTGRWENSNLEASRPYLPHTPQALASPKLDSSGQLGRRRNAHDQASNCTCLGCTP